MTVNIALLPGNSAVANAALPEYIHVNSPASAQSDLAAVAQAVARAKRIVVVCGAGISVASGIPDFRSSDGLFRTLKDENPKELLSSGKDLFDSSVFSVPERTALFYKMIAQLATLSSNAAPSPFHHFLKLLDQRGQLLRLYTQNIDSLEEKAGLSSGMPTWPKSASTTKAAGAATIANNASALDGNNISSEPTTPSSSPVKDRTGGTAGTTATANTNAIGAGTINSGGGGAPRCIPLHGTLKQLICQRCSHAIPLSSEIETLAQGHSVPCPQCTSDGSARRMEGKRHRGVGRMRPSVVLYGEEHLAGEGVGECVRRDLIGLGDPLPSSSSSQNLDPSSSHSSTATPSTSTHSSSHNAVSTASTSTSSPTKQSRRPKQRASASAQPDLLIVAGSSLKVPGTKRIVREFAKAVLATSGVAPGGSGTVSRASTPLSTSGAGTGKSKRGLLNGDADDMSTSSEHTLAGSSSPSATLASHAQSDTESSMLDVPAPSTSSASHPHQTSSNSQGDAGPNTTTVSDTDLSQHPPRTIYLNLDFPVPTRDWKGVFDVWVQGDVQHLVGAFVNALDERDRDNIGVKEVGQREIGKEGTTVGSGTGDEASVNGGDSVSTGIPDSANASSGGSGKAKSATGSAAAATATSAAVPKPRSRKRKAPASGTAVDQDSTTAVASVALDPGAAKPPVKRRKVTTSATGDDGAPVPATAPKRRSRAKPKKEDPTSNSSILDASLPTKTATAAAAAAAPPAPSTFTPTPTVKRESHKRELEEAKKEETDKQEQELSPDMIAARTLLSLSITDLVFPLPKYARNGNENENESITSAQMFQTASTPVSLPWLPSSSSVPMDPSSSLSALDPYPYPHPHPPSNNVRHKRRRSETASSVLVVGNYTGSRIHFQEPLPHSSRSRSRSRDAGGGGDHRGYSPPSYQYSGHEYANSSASYDGASRGGYANGGHSQYLDSEEYRYEQGYSHHGRYGPSSYEAEPNHLPPIISHPNNPVPSLPALPSLPPSTTATTPNNHLNNGRTGNDGRHGRGYAPPSSSSRVQPGLLIRSSGHASVNQYAPAYASSRNRNGNGNGRANVAVYREEQPPPPQAYDQGQQEDMHITDVLPVKKRTRTRKPKTIPPPSATTKSSAIPTTTSVHTAGSHTPPVNMTNEESFNSPAPAHHAHAHHAYPPPLPPHPPFNERMTPPEFLETGVEKPSISVISGGGGGGGGGGDDADDIQIDPALLEDDTSASLIRTASLGLRDRSGTGGVARG